MSFDEFDGGAELSPAGDAGQSDSGQGEQTEQGTQQPDVSTEKPPSVQEMLMAHLNRDKAPEQPQEPTPQEPAPTPAAIEPTVGPRTEVEQLRQQVQAFQEFLKDPAAAAKRLQLEAELAGQNQAQEPQGNTYLDSIELPEITPDTFLAAESGEQILDALRPHAQYVADQRIEQRVMPVLNNIAKALQSLTPIVENYNQAQGQRQKVQAINDLTEKAYAVFPAARDNVAAETLLQQIFEAEVAAVPDSLKQNHDMLVYLAQKSAQIASQKFIQQPPANTANGTGVRPNYQQITSPPVNLARPAVNGAQSGLMEHLKASVTKQYYS